MNDCKYWYWDNVLTKEFCDQVLKESDFQNSSQGQVGVQDNKFELSPIRKTSIVWQPYNSIVGCVINTFARIANSSSNWNFDIDLSEAIQIGKYEEGNGHYDWHTDTHVFDNGKQRKLSVSVLLNDPSEFEGGSFDFDDGEENLLKSRGSILVFPSFLRHRVTPVTKGVRYSAVSWIAGNLFK